MSALAPLRPAPAAARPPAPVLRRCGCGGAPGASGECEACRKKRLGLQRSAPAAAPDVAPPIVHDVLRAPGQPLDAGTRAFMEPRFGHSFAEVRVHTDARAADSARAVGARAYSVGRDVVFGRDAYRPASVEGSRLIAHELTHVVQQQGAAWSPGAPLAVGDDNGAEEREAAAVEAGTPVRPVPRGAGAATALRRRPDYIVDHTFLGHAVRGGVNPVMKQRLEDVEAHLQAQFDALPPDQRVNPTDGTPATTVGQWAGIREAPGCWRNSTSKHGSGSACDINYTRTPYIVTRTEVAAAGGGTRTVLGGERAGRTLQTQRQRTVDVFDRAAAFVGAVGDTADVSARRPGESTATVYRRFRSTSDALRDYLQYAFHEPTNPRVDRAPLADPDGATEAELLAAIPETERRPLDEAVAELQTLLDNHEFQVVHSNWPHDARGQYLRMLRDYEMVRVPMVFGNPVATPAATRNPAGGFLDLRQELVEALVDIGHLRWGAADLGENESGDMHHFDLGDHGGYTPGP
jgi:hypothetical protein